MSEIKIKGRGVIGGTVRAEALVCADSILGMAGFNDQTGEISEVGHAQKGTKFDGKILVLPCSKGSCGWSAHFHSAKMNGHISAGWIFSQMDSKAGVGCVVLDIPAVADFPDDVDLFALIENGDILEINGDTGEVVIFKE